MLTCNVGGLMQLHALITETILSIVQLIVVITAVFTLPCIVMSNMPVFNMNQHNITLVYYLIHYCPMLVFNRGRTRSSYARLACILDIIVCSGRNIVLTIVINWIILRTIMGELSSYRFNLT